MGVGFIIACAEANADLVMQSLADAGGGFVARIGRVVSGSPSVHYREK